MADETPNDADRSAEPAEEPETPPEDSTTAEEPAQPESPESPDAADAPPEAEPPAPVRRKSRLGLAVTCAAVAAIVWCTGLLHVLEEETAPPVDSAADSRAEAEAAYKLAALAARLNPDDLDAAIERFQSVAARHAGSAWGEYAVQRAEALEFKREERARALAAAQLERELAGLQAAVADLLAKDRFGAALERLAFFEGKRPVEQALELVAALRAKVLAAAQARYDAVARAAEAAIAAKDFQSARAALEPVEGFGMPDLTQRAATVRGEIDSRQKHAEMWAKWDSIKSRAERQGRLGHYATALEILDEAKALPLEGLPPRVAEARKALEAARKKAVADSLAAYAARSNEVWQLFLDRAYDTAEKLLLQAQTDPEFTFADEPLRADRHALERLRQFWSAVARGIASRRGKSFVIRDLYGTLTGFADGTLKLRVDDAEGGEAEYAFPMHKLLTRQAVGCARLGTDSDSQQRLGIFLTAEGRDLDTLNDADRALAAAAGAPFAAAYRARLAAIRQRVLEGGARELWKRIAPYLETFLDDWKALRANALLTRFLTDYRRTPCAREVDKDVRELQKRIRETLGRPRFAMRVKVQTAPDGPGGSDDTRVELLINGNPDFRRRLDKFGYGGRKPGTVDTYHFDFYTGLPSVIKGVRLNAYGTGAWRCESIEFQFVRGKRKSKARRFIVRQTFGGESTAAAEAPDHTLWFDLTKKR